MSFLKSTTRLTLGVTAHLLGLSNQLIKKENRREFIDALLADDMNFRKRRAERPEDEYLRRRLPRTPLERRSSSPANNRAQNQQNSLTYDYDDYKKLQYQYSIIQGEKQAEEEYIKRTEIYLKSIVTLKTHVEQLELELESKRREFERMFAENQVLHEERYSNQDIISRITIENQDLMYYMNLIKTEYEEYKNLMAVKERELESTQQEYRVSQVTLEKLKKENKDLSAESNTVKRDHEETVTVHERIASDNLKLSEDVNYHRQLQEEAANACSGLEQKNERLKDEIEELRNQLADSQNKIHYEEKKTLVMHSQVLELECAVRDKELLLRECKDEVEELDKAMKSFLSENATLKKRIQEMQETREYNEKGYRELEDMDERITYEHSRIKELIAERRTMEDSRETIKSSILTSQSRLKAFLKI